MSTPLTRDFKHRKAPGIRYYLEEQFGELQITVEGDGTAFVLRLHRDDAQALANAMDRWLAAKEREEGD